MYQSPRLPALRYALKSAFARQQRDTHTVTPGLHHLLPVPLRERLILLAKIDGATPQVIRRTLPVSREDAEGQSPEMLFAIRTWQQTLDDAYWHVPTRSNWRHQKHGSVDKGLKQLLWADVAVALIGDTALPEIVNALSLRRRLVLYTLLVQEAPWREVKPLFRCTNHEIRESIRIGLKATGGK